MKHFGKLLIVVVSFALLAGVLGLLPNGRAGAGSDPPGSAPVTVVNTPLPVTGSIMVGGTVNVGNTPLPVQAVVVNVPGSTPFSETLTSAAPQFAVPTTIGGQSVQAVVVTELSGFCTGIGSFNLGLQDVVGGSPVTTFTFPVGTLQFGVFPLLAHQTNIFIAAGHSVGIDDNVPPHGCHVDLSGYYVTQ